MDILFCEEFSLEWICYEKCQHIFYVSRELQVPLFETITFSGEKIARGEIQKINIKIYGHIYLTIKAIRNNFEHSECEGA